MLEARRRKPDTEIALKVTAFMKRASSVSRGRHATATSQLIEGILAAATAAGLVDTARVEVLRAGVSARSVEVQTSGRVSETALLWLWGALGFLAGLAVGLGADDLVGLNDKRPFLALANMRAEGLRLPEGHPDRRGVSFLDRLRPQHQDIDALIGDAVRAQGPRDASLAMPRTPRLEPRPDALLKLAYDLIGDLLINISSHWLSFLAFRLRMQPTRPRANERGVGRQDQKTWGGAGRSGATTRPAFFARRAWP
jgi:hypothetical protein